MSSSTDTTPLLPNADDGSGQSPSYNGEQSRIETEAAAAKGAGKLAATVSDHVTFDFSVPLLRSRGVSQLNI